MDQASILPLVACVILAGMLAGCSTAPEAERLDAGPDWVTIEPVVLAEGSFRWHDPGTGPAGALDYYELASQAVAHPCVWDGGGGEEVYFNNLHLPTGRQSQGLGPWSGNLTVWLDWTDEDWIGTILRVAYQAPGLDGWHMTPPIERGSEATVAVRVRAAEEGEGEGDEDEAGDEPDGASDWSVWVCLGEDTGSGPPEPFIGDVDAKVAFAPDPILERERPVADDGAGRTARDDPVPTQPAL